MVVGFVVIDGCPQLPSGVPPKTTGKGKRGQEDIVEEGGRGGWRLIAEDQGNQ